MSTFHPNEVGTIYVDASDRFVVSLIVGYTEGDDIATPRAAALAALELTQDEGWTGTTWHVFDRKTGLLHQYEQRVFAQAGEFGRFEAVQRDEDR